MPRKKKIEEGEVEAPSKRAKAKAARKEQIIADMKEKFGKSSVARGDEVKTHGRIPFGITIIDLATGGGAPVGEVTECFGEKSSFKTGSIIKLMASAQKTCRNCVAPIFPDKEDPTKKACSVCGKYLPMRIAWGGVEEVHTEWWSTLGADPAGVELFRGETTQEFTDMIDVAIRSGEWELFVIDSLGALASEEEAEASAVDGTRPAVGALAINSAFRKWNSALLSFGWGQRPTVIVINQVRTGWSQNRTLEVLPGGNAQQFAATIQIRFHASGFIFDTEKRPLYEVVQFECVKNKSFFPKLGGYFRVGLWPHPFTLEEKDEEGNVEKVEVQVKTGDTFEPDALHWWGRKLGLITGRKDIVVSPLEVTVKSKSEFFKVVEDPVLNWKMRVAIMEAFKSRPSDGVEANRPKPIGEVKP